MAKTASRSNFESYLRSFPIKHSEEHAEALLLTCIDFRFFRIIDQMMCDLGLRGKFDHFILAGAALGATLDFNAAHLPAPQPMLILPRLHWQQVFFEHLELATTLHNTIHRVVIIEHRDCGAYKTFLKPGGYATPREERSAHKKQADKLEELIRKFNPKLTVDKFLARLNPKTVGPLFKISPDTMEDLELERLN